MVAAPSMPRRLRLTRAHVAALMEAGLVQEARYELRDGELLEKMPQNKPHVISCRRTTHALEDRFGRARVGSQAPVVLDEVNEPEPDVFVTCLPLEDYPGNPGASEVLLLIEVSDTTLRLDRTEKAERYAQAGIPEYWVLDVPGRRVLVHREPGPDGYGSIQSHTEPATLSFLAFPEAPPVSLTELLPPE